MAAAVTLTGSLVSRCLEVVQNSDVATLKNLVDGCLAQQASISRDLKLRTAHLKLDPLFARADHRWEELRQIGAASGTWSQAQCASIVENCIEDLARTAVAMNSLNELVWSGREISEDGALDECMGITGAAGQQLILVATIALKVAKDTGVSLSSSVTHARYDFDTICNIGTACIRAYLDRAFPEPATLGTKPGHCRIECQDPAGEKYFASDEVQAGASSPAFAAAMSAANAARRKKVSSETEERAASAGLSSMWASVRSLCERRGPRRAEPRSR